MDPIKAIVDKGGVALVPTDTLYGLAASAIDKKAVERVFSIKRRPKNKKISVMIHPEILEEWFAFPSWIWEFLPGPYTFLVRPLKKLALPYKKIGVRVPDLEETLYFLERFDYPLTATSANFSGGPDPVSLDKVPICIRRKVDIILYGRPYFGQGSTVVDVETKRIIRKGAGYETIARYLKAAP